MISIQLFLNFGQSCITFKKAIFLQKEVCTAPSETFNIYSVAPRFLTTSDVLIGGHGAGVPPPNIYETLRKLVMLQEWQHPIDQGIFVFFFFKGETQGGMEVNHPSPNLEDLPFRRAKTAV